MTARRVATAMLIFCVQTISVAGQVEPNYRGKPLSYWVERLQKAETGTDQQDAADAIKAFGPDAAPAAPKLIRMLEDRCVDYRSMIRDVMVAIGPGNKAVLPQLVKLLKQKPDSNQRDVLAVVRSMGAEAKEAIPVLTEMLDDPRYFYESTEVLTAIGPAANASLPAIKRAIFKVRAIEDEGDWATTYWSGSVIRFLHKLGPDAIPILIELLDSEDIGYKSYSAFGLGELGPVAKAAIPRLRKAMKHDDAEVRRYSATALWRIEKNLDVVPVLTELLKDRHRYIFEEAAKTLGEIGPDAKEALPALRAASVEYGYELRRAIKRIESHKKPME